MTTLHRVASDKVRKTRPISWLKAARKDFERFPQGAKDECLDALSIAAEGGKAPVVKPLPGIYGGVFEIALPFRGNAFRVSTLFRSALRSGCSMPFKRNQPKV